MSKYRDVDRFIVNTNDEYGSLTLARFMYPNQAKNYAWTLVGNFDKIEVIDQYNATIIWEHNASA